MAQRLIKVAKELNVGISTIVDFLDSKGFQVDNRPTSKITDEMHDLLLQEFSNSIAIKQQADNLVIGHRNQKEEPTPPVVEQKREPIVEPPVKKTPEPPQPPPPPVEEIKVEEVQDTPVKEEVKEPTPPVVEPPKRESTIGLKILGKIDLDKHKRPKKVAPKDPVKKEEIKPAAETKKAVEDKKPVIEAEKPKVTKVVEKEVKETPKPDVVEKTPIAKVEDKSPSKKSDIEPPRDKSNAPLKEGDELTRAKTPELRGLKILGKIEIKDTKKDTKPKAKPGESSDPRKRRKRTRRKVVANTSSGQRNRGRGNNTNRYQKNRKPEVKEVSKKEIEDKIKLTLAKLSGSGKKKRQKSRRDHRESVQEKQELIRQEKEITTLQVTEFISVSELASIMDISATDIIMTCMNLGEIVSINQRLDAAIIELLGEEFGHEIEFIDAESAEEEEEIIDAPEDLVHRAPIVTIMGHVDHGKTSLLDYIRKAKVAEGEAGGITQHIGAYEVDVEGDKKITFLDTPGHEAFTAMRARGAKVTDIAVIIVAADDSIMPQTKEAISHAQAAGVPIIFAINKIDKAGANPDKIKQELASMNLMVEEWGGSIQSQDISAKNGTNVDLLMEKILLEAEIQELQANPKRAAIGTIIEASLDKGRGYVSKVLVQTGTLKVGDILLAGQYSGKVKALYNDLGKKIKTAGPSTPVLVLGLDGAPQAGERLKVVESEQEARRVASGRAQIMREQANRASKRISLDEIGRRLALGNFKELNLIVKGDVDGSIEALADSLIKQSIDTVQVNVIHKAVGPIIESDVLLAAASDAIIIGFQVRPSVVSRRLADQEGVEIKLYSVIYQAIDEIRSAIEGMLEPTIEEKIVAQIEVRETYKISKIGTIAGSYVTEGKVTRNNFIRVIRDGIVVFPKKEGVVGELSSLKRFKDDVKEVRNGFECGITIKNFNDIKVGDVIECYETVEIKQTLDKQR